MIYCFSTENLAEKIFMHNKSTNFTQFEKCREIVNKYHKFHGTLTFFIKREDPDADHPSSNFR